jgi:hypothetical protein
MAETAIEGSVEEEDPDRDPEVTEVSSEAKGEATKQEDDDQSLLQDNPDKKGYYKSSPGRREKQSRGKGTRGQRG